MKMCFEASASRRCHALILLLIAGYCLTFDQTTALAEDKATLKGRVSDIEGRPVEGARVFLYTSPDVRRPADFISAPSAGDGLFRMVPPPGKYRAVARLKKKEGFGPLMPGDRHSGEPEEVELAAGKEVTLDFVVADLKDAIKTKKKARESAVRVSGRIVDEQGSPVTKAYAFAYRDEKGEGIPDYLSAWADKDGRYTLYLPVGNYYIGGTETVPPQQASFPKSKIIVDADRSGLDIVMRTRATP